MLDWILISVTCTLVGPLLLWAALSRKPRRHYFGDAGLWRKDNVPLTLVFDELDFNGHKEALTRSIEFWRRNMPLNLVNPAGDISIGGLVVPVTVYQTQESYDGARGKKICSCSAASVAFARIDHGTEIRGASIHVNHTLARSLGDDGLFRVFAHEIGHVLGLAHDKNPSSVMYSKVSLEKPILTTADKTFLLQAYGK